MEQEEKALEWRQIVEILKLKGNEVLISNTNAPAAGAAPSATASHSTTATPANTLPAGEGAAKKKKKKKKKQQADQPLEAPILQPAQPAGVCSGVKQAGFGSREAMKQAPLPAPFVFTAGIDNVDPPVSSGKTVLVPLTANGQGGVQRTGSLGSERSLPVESHGAATSRPYQASSTGENKETLEGALAELGKKSKKKKKKSKAGGGTATQGPVSQADAGAPSIGSEKGDASSESKADEHDTQAKESPLSPSSHTEPDEEPLSLQKPSDPSTEEATGWSDTEDVPGFMSDSDGSVSQAEESDQEEGLDQEEGSEEGPQSGDGEDWGKEGDGGWGELEEDDVEQLLTLGLIQKSGESRDSWKTVPTRKKRALPSAPPKATPAAPNKFINAKQNGSAAPPSSFRAPGGSSDHRELNLPGGRVVVNRADFNARPAAAKFFVIKSNSVDDVHKSIKYGVWASTSYGNKRLHAAYQEAQAAQPPCRVFLLFSVNASGQFCGVAEMMSDVDFSKSVDVWQEDNLWNGQFKVHWHLIKDVPNRDFWHIRIASNENKPVTNSRDTQDVPYRQGLEMLGIFKASPSTSSILDYFAIYDTRQTLLQEDREKAKQKLPPGLPDLREQGPEVAGPPLRPQQPVQIRPAWSRNMAMPFNAKTKLCQRFSSPNGCDYGDRCFFAHGVEELRPHPPGPPFPQNGFVPPLSGPNAFYPPPGIPQDYRNRAPSYPATVGPSPVLSEDQFQASASNSNDYYHRPEGPRGAPLFNGQQGVSDKQIESVADSFAGATLLDEKEMQDEYLLQLLTASGGSEKATESWAPTVDQGSGYGLREGHEAAGGLEHHDDEEVCCICFERAMDTLLIPCSHALCRQCAELMQSARNSCPMCSQQIEMILPRT